jgi:amidase
MRSITRRFGGRGKAIAAKLAGLFLGSLLLSPVTEAFELDEVTIADLQQGMETGKYTARSIVEKYLRRIDEIDRNGPSIRAVLEVNPDALAIADQLDRERRNGKVRGPLHGIPILLKDNIETADRMQTTAGSFALEGVPVKRMHTSPRSCATPGRSSSERAT